MTKSSSDDDQAESSPYAAHAGQSSALLLARGLEPVRCAVVHPCDEASLSGALEAARRGLIIPVLVGPSRRILELARASKSDIASFERIDVPHSHAAADAAAEAALGGDVEVLMKGSLHTDELLHAVLAKPGLRTERRMSHVFRFDVPAYPKPLIVTDAAINIAPSLVEKADIVQNAIDFARMLGVVTPKVALLAAVETVSPGMPATLDAAALCKMADRGQIKGGLVDGPLAFDLAISAQAAKIKAIRSSVAGDADILVAPNIESANMLAKQLEYLAGASGAGLVVGARVPIALTSRSDSSAMRASSAALALIAAHQLRLDPIRSEQLRCPAGA
jgi:phosphate acetyltransferase